MVAVPTHALAELPPTVTFAQAATLPVAGLTALHAIGKGGSLVGRNVLVTGASGGVGHFAIQLARLGGARVVGLVHQERHAAAARDIGAHEVVVGETADGAAGSGPYHLIVESVGGDTLASALTLLALEGICVCFGQSGSGTATIDVGRFYATGGVRLYGLFLFTELRHEPASVGLARLLRLIEEGRLRAPVDQEASWDQIGQVSQDLVERRFPGKAVLRIT
jgi:NADPH:quinone reductase-like Zn-dependent oxidoreductase